MLYSLLAAFVCYYAILFVIGILVNAMAIEGSLIVLAVICFIGAYLTRIYSKVVFRMTMSIGIVATTLLVAIWVLLPILAGNGNVWLRILSIVAGLVVYIATRRHIFHHYLHRPAPPFGREWCRWLFAFLM